MFSFLFFQKSQSWNDMALTVGMELMFRSTGDDGKKFCQQILDCGNEKVDRLSLAGSWIDYVERAPFNTKNFNHWRYKKTPMGDFVKGHTTEDILTTLKSLVGSISSTPALNGEWALNFGFKVYQGLFLETSDPTHTVEYFTSSGPLSDGDDNGKLYKVLYKGNETNLHDFWGSLCGQLNDHYPFSSSAYDTIDSFTTEIFKTYNSDHTKTFKTYNDLFNDTLQFAQSNLYENVEYGKELPEEYVNMCKKYAPQRLATAAYSLGQIVKKFPSPQCKSAEQQGKTTMPFTTVGGLGWAVFFMLLPVAFYLGGNLFRKPKD